LLTKSLQLVAMLAWPAVVAAENQRGVRFRSSPASWRHNAGRWVQRSWNQPMLIKRFCSALLLTAGAVALSGCVAVPLAQMAVSQAAPATAPCAAGTGCQTGLAGGGFGAMSKGVSDSFRQLTSLAADSTPTAPTAPTAPAAPAAPAAPTK
jgi:peptidoglycan/LPS O-acetylase OafA/YrhL